MYMSPLKGEITCAHDLLIGTRQVDIIEFIAHGNTIDIVGGETSNLIRGRHTFVEPVLQL